MRSPSPLRRCLSVVISVVILPWQPLAGSFVRAEPPTSIAPAAAALPEDLAKDPRYQEALGSLVAGHPPLDLGKLSGDRHEDYLASLRADSEKQRGELGTLKRAWASWFLELDPSKRAPGDDPLKKIEAAYRARPLLPGDPAQRQAVLDGNPAAKDRLESADRLVRAIADELAEARVLWAELGEIARAMEAKPGNATDAKQRAPAWRQRLKTVADRTQAANPEAAIRFHLEQMGFGAVSEADLRAELQRDARLTEAEVAQLAEIAKPGLGAEEIARRVDQLLYGSGARERGPENPDPSEIAGRLVRASQGPLASVADRPAPRPAPEPRPEPRQAGLKVKEPPMTVTRAAERPLSPPQFSLTPLQGVQLAADVAQGRQAAYLIDRKNFLVRRAEAMRAVLRGENADGRAYFEAELAAIYGLAGTPEFEERLKAWLDATNGYIHSRITSQDGALEERLKVEDRIKRLDAAQAVNEALGYDSALMDAFRRLSQQEVSGLAAKARAGQLNERESRLWDALNAYWDVMGEDKLAQFYAQRPARKALRDLENQERAFHSDALVRGDVPSGTSLRVDEVDLQRLAERLGAYEALDPKAKTVTAETRKIESVGGSSATDVAYTGITITAEDGRTSFVSADRRLRETRIQSGDGRPMVLRRLFDGSGAITAIEQALDGDPRNGIRQEGRFDDNGQLVDGRVVQADAGRVTETTVAGGHRTFAATRDADGDLTGAVRFENGRPAAVWDRATGRTSYYEYLASNPERQFRLGESEVEVTVIRRGAPDGPILEAFHEPASVDADFARRARELAGHAGHEPAVAQALDRFNALSQDASADPARRKQAFDAVIEALRGKLGEDRKAALDYLAGGYGRTHGVRYNFLRDGRLSPEAVDGLDISAEGEGPARRDVYTTFRPDGTGGWSVPESVSKLDDRRDLREQVVRGPQGEERSYYRYAATGHPDGGGRPDLRVQLKTKGPEEGSEATAASAFDGDTEYRFEPGTRFEAGKPARPTEKIVRDAAGGFEAYKRQGDAWVLVARQKITPQGRVLDQWEGAQLTRQVLDRGDRPLWVYNLNRDESYRDQDVNVTEFRYLEGGTVEVYYKAQAGRKAEAAGPPADAAVAARRVRYGRGNRPVFEANLDPKQAAAGDYVELDATWFLDGNRYFRANRSTDPKSRQQWVAETGRWEMGAHGHTTTVRNRYKPANGHAWTDAQVDPLRQAPGVNASFALASVPPGLESAAKALGQDTMIIPGEGGRETVVLEVPGLAGFGGDRDARRAEIVKRADTWAQEMAANMPNRSTAPGATERTQRMLRDFFVANADRLNSNRATVTLSPTGEGGIEVRHRIQLVADKGSGRGEVVNGFFEVDNTRHFQSGPNGPRMALVTKAAEPWGLSAVEMQQWRADNVLTTSIISGKQQVNGAWVPERVEVVRNEFMFGDNGDIVRLRYHDSAVQEGVMVVSKKVSVTQHLFRVDQNRLQEVGPAGGRRLGDWQGRVVDEKGRDRATALGQAVDDLNNNVVAEWALHKPMDLSSKLVTGVMGIMNMSAGGWRRLFGDNEGAGINEAHAWSEGLRATGMLSSDPNKREQQVVSLADRGYARKLTTEARDYIDGMARTYREASLNNQGGEYWMTSGERTRLLTRRINDYERIATVADVGWGNYGKMAGAGAFGEGAKRFSSVITVAEGFVNSLPMFWAGGAVTKSLQ
ncbi:MAG: hypothetical protein HY553_17565, partial [Elusimicrobia bacterium]|nr:hypothetical protein [Elusimicrobiota bacterium]